MPHIEPTVGRVVWYHPAMLFEDDERETLAATVAYVHGGGKRVNLGFLRDDGSADRAAGVWLLQDGEAPPAWDCDYCEWMPYQKGQAAKTEQAERSAKIDPRKVQFLEDCGLPAAGIVRHHDEEQAHA
jgi:hypothetical protein